LDVGFVDIVRSTGTPLADIALHTLTIELKNTQTFIKGIEIMTKQSTFVAFTCVLFMAFGCGDRSGPSGVPGSASTATSEEVTLGIGNPSNNGQLVVPITTTLIGSSPTSIQFDVQFDNTKLQFISANTGSQNRLSNSTISSVLLPGNQGVRVVISSSNQSLNGISPIAELLFVPLVPVGEAVDISISSIITSTAASSATIQSTGTQLSPAPSITGTILVP
jgi:hypothetical protein